MAVRAGLSRFGPLGSCLAAAVALLLLAAPAGQPRSPSGATVLTVGGPVGIHAIPPGFVGLSFEYWAIPDYAGNDPSAVNPVFLQLIRNLAGGYATVLRIGGVTTDTTWWPIPGMPTPAGMTYNLTHRWIAGARALAAALRPRLILGINLEADSATVAAVEAKKLLAGIGRRWVEALELGNEPELYGAFQWGLSSAPGRPQGYDFAAFDADFSRIARRLPDVPLAGPTAGTPAWFRDLGAFLSDQPRVAVATLHRYPLRLCFADSDQPIYPTVAHLLAPTATRSLADSVAAAVETAHAHHASVRIDEMNSVSCGQHYVPVVTHTFASALWVLDALFEMARVGVDGVNIHSYPDATYSPFAFRRVRGRWRARVAPDYYGLEMFAQAAPTGSRLLRVSPTGAPGFEVWAVRARNHTIRVVAINEGTGGHDIAVRVPGASGNGSLERLRAPSLLARDGVTLGGQGFGAATATGLPAGPRRVLTVARARGEYRFRVPAASAAMLTLAGS
jgi:hypothetical protein